MKATIAEALREMRGLHDTNAGRLRGVSLRYRSLSLPYRALGATPAPWRDQLQTAITAREAGTVAPDSPEYLVFSDNVVVTVLTAAGRVLLPDCPLTTIQTRHQCVAAEALNDLHRHALRELADRRAAWDGREQDAAAEYEQHPDGALRVAPLADPTDTRWVYISADLDQTRRAIRSACSAEPEQVIIVTAAGYGKYGRERHRISLDMLVAMHQIADKHQVSLCAVGNWLDVETATTTDANPQMVVEQFTAAYLGPFSDEMDYTRQRMTELGWTQALQNAGIPERYLDLRAINWDWFTHQVRQVSSGSPRRIEVFHRKPAT